MKTPKKQLLCDVFKGYKMRTLDRNWLIRNQLRPAASISLKFVHVCKHHGPGYEKKFTNFLFFLLSGSVPAIAPLILGLFITTR